MGGKIGKLTAALLALLVLAAAGGWLWLRTALPQTEGEIVLAGLEAPVSVTRDGYGIPHIRAESETDAHFALGFVHAQDRLWQMEMHRRIAAGRLSEIAGAATASTDIWLRTLSLRQRAGLSWSGLDDDTKGLLEAYAAGVNAFLAQRRGAWPPEFLLTGIRPEAWTPVDTLSWLKVMALDLGGNMNRELARLDLAGQLDPRQLADFFPPYPGEPALPLPELAELYDGALPRHAALVPGADAAETGLGSNNWVISGELTQGGAPLLANDPHLRLNTPSLWYLVHLAIAGRHRVGVTMPGSPFIVLGRNDDIAWGFTNTAPDVQDLFLERLDADGEGYVTAEGVRAFSVRRETVVVKDGEPVAIAIRETHRGPVVSDARADIAARLPAGHALSLRWTALDPDDGTAMVAPRLARARDLAEAQAALVGYVAPMQSIVIADRAGDIGLFAPGRIPLRGEGDATRGLIPKPGWKAGQDWQGYLPPDALPRRVNPPEGRIATANEKIVADDYPHFLTSEWSMPYRGDRVRALLDGQDDHNPASMAAIQRDVRSTVADDLLPHMLAAMEGRGDDLLAAMAAWDREMRIDAPEPLVFTAWHRHLFARIAADELGPRFEAHRGAHSNFLGRALRGEAGQARWCDDVTTPATESCEEMAVAAFGDAVAELGARFGASWRDWRWGDAHRVVMTHNPLSQVPPLRRFFELSAPAPGGLYTVNVATPRWVEPDLYSFSHGASFRGIFDLGTPDNSLYVIPTGQSGIPFSPHYRDLFPLWLDGGYIHVPTSRPVDGDTLMLLPARDS